MTQDHQSRSGAAIDTHTRVREAPRECGFSSLDRREGRPTPQQISFFSLSPIQRSVLRQPRPPPRAACACLWSSRSSSNPACPPLASSCRTPRRLQTSSTIAHGNADPEKASSYSSRSIAPCANSHVCGRTGQEDTAVWARRRRVAHTPKVGPWTTPNVGPWTHAGIQAQFRSHGQQRTTGLRPHQEATCKSNPTRRKTCD